jgi:hypothetical protein
MIKLEPMEQSYYCTESDIENHTEYATLYHNSLKAKQFQQPSKKRKGMI